MSLVEVLTATAILMVVAGAVLYFTGNTQILTSKIAKSSECESYAGSVIDAISSLGVRDVVLSPLFDPPAGTNPADFDGSTFYTTNPLFQSFATRLGLTTTDYFTVPIVNNRTIQNSHLMLGSVSYLEALYNNNPNYCSTNTTPAPAALLQGRSINIPGATVSLQIQAVAPDGTVQACNPIKIAPLSGSLSYDAYANTAQRGYYYKASVIVRYTNQSKQPVQCSAEGRFQHQLDNLNQNAPVLYNIVNGDNISIYDADNPNNSTSCGPSAGYKHIRVAMNMTDIEPGSIPICREGSDADTANPNSADYTPCWNFRFGARQVGNNRADFTVGPTTLMYIRLWGLQENEFYEMTVRSVDTAGNISSGFEYVTFYIDGTRPTLQNVRGDGTIIKQPVANPGGNKPRNVTWSPTWIQCDDSDAPVNAGPGTVIADFATQELGNTTCSATINSGTASFPDPANSCAVNLDGANAQVNATGHSSVSVTLTPSDPCGAGTPVTLNYPAVFNFNTTVPGYLPDPIAAFAYDMTNDGPGTYYRVTIPTPSTVAPNYFAVMCDCNFPPNGTEFTAATQCGANVNMTTAVGCTVGTAGSPNFRAAIWDICGRGFNGTYDSVTKTNYSINGSSPTVACPIRYWWQCSVASGTTTSTTTSTTSSFTTTSTTSTTTTTKECTTEYPYQTEAECEPNIGSPHWQYCRQLTGVPPGTPGRGCWKVGGCGLNKYTTNNYCLQYTACGDPGYPYGYCSSYNGGRCYYCRNYRERPPGGATTTTTTLAGNCRPPGYRQFEGMCGYTCNVSPDEICRCGRPMGGGCGGGWGTPPTCCNGPAYIVELDAGPNNSCRSDRYITYWYCP